jgi:sulfide:quinone oxidoreductase
MNTRVLIVGGGVAGLETLAALRALAGNRVDVTILAPELKFINHSMSVEQPFKPQRVRGIKLERAAREFHAHWHQGTLDRVAPEARCAITKAGDRLDYDKLVLATGARYEADFSDALTYRDGRDGPDYRFLLKQLARGDVRRVAFVKPSGRSWPLPLYDLALMTAAHCAADGRSEAELCLVTPEEEPLAAFGKHASDAVRLMLEEAGVTLYTSSYAVPGEEGWLDVAPGHRRIRVDRIVTEPRLVGHRFRGIPFDYETLIPVDAHGRVRGLEDVYAAGDCTNFPVKQGGLAAQQADVTAEAIAASSGADIDPQPFHPVLRGVLLTGGPSRYLRADISGGAGDDSTISAQPLWWPPDKLAGRYLAPYISRQTGSALDVHMPGGEHAIPVEATLDTPHDAPPGESPDRPHPFPRRFARKRRSSAPRRPPESRMRRR